MKQQGLFHFLLFLIPTEICAQVASDLNREGKGSQGQCLTETGLDLHNGTLVMAPTDTFSQKSFGQCLRFCMSQSQGQNHLLISYYNAFVIGDKFNCMCADDEDLENATALSNLKCDVQCPQSNYKCGNAKKDFLSSYCLQRGCSHPSSPICATRKPHDIHGCVKLDFVDWSHTHNSRNFTESDGDSACIWECRDNHIGSIFALTRKIGSVLTCSCGFPGSFQLSKLVSPEFCGIFKQESSGMADYYSVNCVTDLDDGNTTIPDGGARCADVGPVGCVYQDAIFDLASQPYLSITLTTTEAADVTLCLRACQAVFPSAYFAGARHQPSDGILDCFCLRANAFNASNLGPSANCNQFCGSPDLGLHCGNNPETRPYPSLSLYCLSAESENAEQRLSSEATGFLDEEKVENIHQELQMTLVTSQVLVGLLTLLCIIMTSALVYLCYTQGVASLSRYVMSLI